VICQELHTSSGPAMQCDAISHKKKPRLVATGFLVEIVNSLANFELAPNDAS
jgi:hypothetical protein